MTTEYGKGYSTREETVSDGETDISIYNEDEGITYRYTLGESTGSIERDDEDDLLDLEKEKAMEGQSLLTIVEDEFAGAANLELTADRDKVLGRKAIKVDIVITTENGDILNHVIYFDREYLVAIKGEIQWGNGVFIMVPIESEYNLKLDDSLFEAPKDVTFTE